MHTPRSHTSALTAHLTATAARLHTLTSHLRRRRPASPPDRSTPLTSRARVPTSRSARYAKQLCSHAGWKAARAQWTEPHGVIEFPGGTGRCTVTAEPDCLLLAVEAADPQELATMQRIIGANIERFAAREGLTVRWVPD
ncbi:DUF2218 domain-containing protein [Streptacidiphilus sp. EB103A]|uniref:DUF2218 domain-containing protein n=1 Tax=Streptacidiphilus sp. EB103A TaxID=3156275 RepID=UPI003512D552